MEVYLASYDAFDDDSVINLGSLRSFFDYFRFHRINTLVRSINPDLVHAHVLNHYGLMSIFQPKPLLVALWGSDVMLAPYSGSLFKRICYRAINCLVLLRSNWCHTSGAHVLEEASSQCFQKVKDKSSVYYWGFPLVRGEYFLRAEASLRELGLDGEGYCVFPRGVSDIYSPEMYAKIIRAMSFQETFKGKIVVLRGFSSDSEVEKFKRLTEASEYVFVDRLLSEDELKILYSRSKYHFSVPKSDALGGGVIEPALEGSYPVLSWLPSYEVFAREHGAYIIKDDGADEIRDLCHFLVENYTNPNLHLKNLEDFETSNIVDKIIADYSKCVLNK
ncbi:hypothetical protein Bb109J_c1522 [Bdellovibrio bacteriovorus]|nr:hypothetical protein Bb109J_c1522 [Bdellovibrio bacteriovorus]